MATPRLSPACARLLQPRLLLSDTRAPFRRHRLQLLLHVLKLKLGGMRTVIGVEESQWMDKQSRQLVELAIAEVSRAAAYAARTPPPRR